MLNGFSVEKKPMSSLHDNTHSIYGSFCDYFITRDERLAKKVKLVYDYINCPTIVLFDKENKWIELIESPTDYQNKHKLDWVLLVNNSFLWVRNGIWKLRWGSIYT
ncbi:hypothetical protein KOF27_06785 [Providencia rettgeri]|uniref:Uncharacterized protein n=1 Tax=Providencia rettgeri TaxID=587 RepID=A0AAJ4TJK3_PRORE|nr:hypothetical protein [Providencia rettgeri]QWQ22027.2 hypothetical protein KOF27_06785 [Providencia rettgeri]